MDYQVKICNIQQKTVQTDLIFHAAMTAKYAEIVTFDMILKVLLYINAASYELVLKQSKQNTDP